MRVRSNRLITMDEAGVATLVERLGNQSHLEREKALVQLQALLSEQGIDTQPWVGRTAPASDLERLHRL